jgi:hypothetical protein
MNYKKLLLISLVVVMTVAAAPQGLRRFSAGRSFTNQWAMAMLFWSAVNDTPAGPENQAQVVVREAGAVLNFARPLAAQSQEEFRWQGRVQPGQSVEIKGVNGNVRAEGYSGNQVEVVAAKRANRSDTKEVEIRVLEHAGGVTICAVYPSADPSRPNECVPGKGGNMNVHNNDVEVSFTVRVPSGVRFVGHTVNGNVDATNIGGDAEVKTVNGSINVSASGIAEASTVNGSIRASMGNAQWQSELKFHTVNGSITIDFPNNLSADVRAETLNGDFNSEFPMSSQSTTGTERRGRPKKVSGTIGGGGRSLDLKTINGDIQLRRGSDRAM